jgi:addiction module HigA family antidote
MLMKSPPHPGLSVKHDCLEPLGLTVTKGAAVLGVSRKALSDLVNGHAGISPEMAIRLSKAFGGSPEVWAGIQLDHDMAAAMKRADQIKVRRFVQPEASQPGN